MAVNNLALDSETESFVKAEVKRLTAGLNFYNNDRAGSLTT
jgi:hypothetical protein